VRTLQEKNVRRIDARAVVRSQIGTTETDVASLNGIIAEDAIGCSMSKYVVGILIGAAFSSVIITGINNFLAINKL